MRLLFGREFHIADVLRLWDGIFADDPYLGVVDYMCVSMLLFLREQCNYFGDVLGSDAMALQCSRQTTASPCRV